MSFRSNPYAQMLRHKMTVLFQIKIKSFLLVYEAVKATIKDQVGWWGYMGRVTWV